MIKKLFLKILSGALVFINVVSFNVFAMDKYNNVDDFVNKSYEIFLSRNATDDAGAEHWSYLIKNHEKSFYDYVVSLVSGDEFMKRDISDEVFVDMLYNFFMGENAGELEKKHWTGRIRDIANESGKTNKQARIDVVKEMIGEPIFREISSDLGITYKFTDLNQFGVEALKNSYTQKRIDYVNSFYKGFEGIEKELYENPPKVENKDQFIEFIGSVLPIFNDKDSENEYEELKLVSSDNIERVVYGIDYDIEFPYDNKKNIYMSPFLQLNEKEESIFLTIGLGVTSRGLGKSINSVELILGNEVIPFELFYKDESKYDSKGISVHEFQFRAKSISDLEVLDRALSSDLSKIRVTFDDGNIYLYSLYEKDRVRNTLRFMSSLYTQIVVSYLLESKDVFDNVLIKSLN